MVSDNMQISPININNVNIAPLSSIKEAKTDSAAQNKNSEILNAQKCYNPSFCGLFKQDGYDVKKDKRVLVEDFSMPPFKDFIVDENQEIKGREKVRFKKDKDGYLHAMNIAPQFGDYPVIKQNAQVADMFRDTVLLPGVTYVTNASFAELGVNDFKFSMADYPEIANLQGDEALVVGSADGADIRPDGSEWKIAGRQWLIKRADQGNVRCWAIVDLTKKGGSVIYNCDGKFSKENNPEFACDFPQESLLDIEDETPLEPYKPAIVSSDSAIVLGGEYVLDLKNNKELSKLFKYKDTVIIGDGHYSDIQTGECYWSVISGPHLAVKKHGESFIVCDLGTESGSTVVPDKTSIKPFIKGVDKIQLKQGDIGDCYLLAPIYALSRNKKGAEILENMVKRDKEGNFLVKFRNSPTFIIRPDDLEDETYRNEVKYGVQSEPAVRAIEKAYAKCVKPVSVLGGKSDRPMFSKIDHGGRQREILPFLTGKKADVCPTYMYSDDELAQKLAEANKNNCVITCTTYSAGRHKKQAYVPQHVYAVYDVSSNGKRILVANPHDTRLKRNVDVHDLKKYFDAVYFLDLN